MLPSTVHRSPAGPAPRGGCAIRRGERPELLRGGVTAVPHHRRRHNPFNNFVVAVQVGGQLIAGLFSELVLQQGNLGPGRPHCWLRGRLRDTGASVYLDPWQGTGNFTTTAPGNDGETLVHYVF